MVDRVRRALYTDHGSAADSHMQMVVVVDEDKRRGRLDHMNGDGDTI